MPKPLHEVIRELRQARGMTQEQLARKAKVTRGHLAQLELGQVATPRLDVVRRLARALSVPLKEML